MKFSQFRSSTFHSLRSKKIFASSPPIQPSVRLFGTSPSSPPWESQWYDFETNVHSADRMHNMSIVILNFNELNDSFVKVAFRLKIVCTSFVKAKHRFLSPSIKSFIASSTDVTWIYRNPSINHVSRASWHNIKSSTSDRWNCIPALQ